MQNFKHAVQSYMEDNKKAHSEMYQAKELLTCNPALKCTAAGINKEKAQIIIMCISLYTRVKTTTLAKFLE